jgi:hypothetical protein
MPTFVAGTDHSMSILLARVYQLHLNNCSLKWYPPINCSASENSREKADGVPMEYHIMCSSVLAIPSRKFSLVLLPSLLRP